MLYSGMDLKRRIDITGEIVGSVEDHFAKLAKKNDRHSGISEIGGVLAVFMLAGEAWAWKLYFDHGAVAMPKLTIEASGTLGRDEDDVLTLRPLLGGYTTPEIEDGSGDNGSQGRRNPDGSERDGTGISDPSGGEGSPL